MDTANLLDWKRWTRMREKPILLMKISWISGFTKMLLVYNSISEMVWVESMALPVASVGVRVTHFLTSLTAMAAAVPLSVPAEVWVSTVSFKKRLPGATNKMLRWASMSIVITY